MKKFNFRVRSSSTAENGGRNLMLEEQADNNLIDLQSNSSVLEDCPKYLRTELWNQISSSSYAKLGGGSSATTDNTSSWSQENQTSSMAEDSDAPGHSRLKLVSYMKLIAQAASIDVGGSDSSTNEVIRRDVPRTYPTHSQFFSNTSTGKEGQMTLARVLRAYSLYDPEVSYCQGMAFIAGLLLMYLKEEMAFAGLIHLMEEPKIRSLYLPSMIGLRVMLFQLQKLLELWSHDLYEHFLNVGIDLTMIATSWFMTAFASDFPLRFASRILDILLTGLDYNILVKVAFVILDLNKDKAMALPNMEDILLLLRKEVTKRPKEELRDIISQALSAENHHFLKDEVLESFKDEFDSIQHEHDLPSEVGDVLGGSDDDDTIGEMQAPDYLSMLMEYGELRSDPQGYDSGTPAKTFSKRGVVGKSDSIFPEEDELDDLENDIGEATFGNSSPENRMRGSFASRDSFFTRSWGQYMGDEAGERFLILDEPPDGQEASESLHSHEPMIHDRYDRPSTDDTNSVENAQSYSIEEDEYRDADLPLDEQEFEKPAKATESEKPAEAMDSKSSLSGTALEANEQKSHIENVSEEVLPTQTTERYGEIQAAAVSLVADSPPKDEDDSLSETKVNSSDEPLEDPPGDAVEPSTTSQDDLKKEGEEEVEVGKQAEREQEIEAETAEKIEGEEGEEKGKEKVEEEASRADEEKERGGGEQKGGGGRAGGQDDDEDSLPLKNEPLSPTKSQIPKRRLVNSKLIAMIAKFENS